MTILESIILAIVEGLTEFLPVSSTGHMILTEGILGMESTAYLKAFTVMIQFGAMAPLRADDRRVYPRSYPGCALQ